MTRTHVRELGEERVDPHPTPVTKLPSARNSFKADWLFTRQAYPRR